MNDCAENTIPTMEKSKTIRLPFVKGESLLLVFLFSLSLLMLAIGFTLDPNPAGHSTHTQLNMDPCGYLQNTGRPCILCGGTTAFTLAAHGRIFSAFWTQPFGATLFFLVLLTGFYTADAMIRRHSLVLRVALWPWGRILVGLILLALFSWYFKILTFKA